MEISEKEKEALKFLSSDFNQCFQQMRHYDSQITLILKFMFTAYTALIGIALGLYQFGLKEQKDFSTPASFALTIGLIIGLFMFSLTVRNRVYFVQVARYINEQRGFFLKFSPIGFGNFSKMYTNLQQPPYFNWRSSHTWLYGIIATLNSTLLIVLLYILEYDWIILAFCSSLLVLIQMSCGILYLRSRESKSASKAVFGRE
ncbi:MAG: hypothetical protein HS130_09290 [Deltaproteobacteria bacterium]|nr:hypothetical protein [Deltaproteobacteria bacterium]MCL4874523.1 hypothetical protein [bacterium]